MVGVDGGDFLAADLFFAAVFGVLLRLVRIVSRDAISLLITL